MDLGEGRKTHFDFEKILPRSLGDTEYSDDTRRFELGDILHVDSLTNISI